jgi:hypothetical protein
LIKYRPNKQPNQQPNKMNQRLNIAQGNTANLIESLAARLNLSSNDLTARAIGSSTASSKSDRIRNQRSSSLNINPDSSDNNASSNNIASDDAKKDRSFVLKSKLGNGIRSLFQSHSVTSITNEIDKSLSGPKNTSELASNSEKIPSVLTQDHVKLDNFIKTIKDKFENNTFNNNASNSNNDSFAIKPNSVSPSKTLNSTPKSEQDEAIINPDKKESECRKETAKVNSGGTKNKWKEANFSLYGLDNDDQM